MAINNQLAKLIALLKVDYMLSDERERITDAERNDIKYDLLCETWQNCALLAQEYKGKLNGNDPDFPLDCHVVELILPTENDEIVLREMKTRLADTINMADEVNIDTDLKGNLRINFGFEDVYAERET